ncbi:MAG: hypothetical protein ACHQ5A_01055 [Opitutales bacterium]
MKQRRPDPGTWAAALWVLAGTWVAIWGWGISLAGAFTRAGWALGAGLLLPVVVAGVWRGVAAGRSAWWRRVVRRLRHPLPAGWLALWVLATTGGALHPPNNIDALAYRLPRVLHWLAGHGWHWIATNDARMNFSACGMEWLMAPWLAVTGSDRMLFLLNALPALLLPGLLFSVFRQAGVARGVAWRWMWLLPAGHVFAFQCGSIGNDAAGAVWLLAACHFALVARRRDEAPWLGLALLAAGLLTGWKSSNLPLLLPWAVVAWPARRLAGRRPAAMIGWAVAAVLVSAGPTLCLNQWYSGHWSGDPANTTAVRLASPWAGVPGNLAQGAVQNLVPPFFPWAGAWNDWSARQLEPVMRRLLGTDFPRFTLHLGEMPQEEWAGLGLLVMVLLLGGVWCVRAQPAPERGRGSLLAWAGVIAALVFCLSLGSEMTARLLAPYYPVLVLPLLRGGGQSVWCGTRTWQWLSGLAMASTGLALILAPARPLLPLDRMAETWGRFGGGRFAERAEAVYTVYAGRADPLLHLRVALPAGITRVGFLATADDTEISFWRPYGSRQVVRLDQQQPPRDAGGRPLEWVVVRADALWPAAADETAWLEHWHGQVVRRQSLKLKASRPPELWVLVRLSPAGSDAGR